METTKLLFVIPSLVGGGAENALIKLLKAMDYKRYRVTLLVVCYRGVYIDQVPANIELKYLFKRDLLVRGLAYLQKKWGWSWPLRWAFRRTMPDDFDTAVSFLDSNFTDLLFLLRPSTKKITWVHSSYVSNQNFNRFYSNNSYRQRVIEQRYRLLDTLVFVSNDAKQEFIEVMGVFPDMRVLYNLFDEDEIRRKAMLPIPVGASTDFTFVAVGSLLPVKGYDLLIAAAKIAIQQGYRFRVEIVGKGPEEEVLKREIQTLGLEEVVVFRGYQKNPFAYIQSGDVFVMTSVSEALPSVLCEALILGKPVLITDTPGCREVIEWGKYGMMTERNREAFAYQMMACIDDPSLVEQFRNLSVERGKGFSKAATLEAYQAVLG